MMGICYFLVCMNCKTAVNLGKTVHTKYENIEKGTYGFSSFGSLQNGVWEPTVENAETLQHFLMLHRTHELRVLPENVEKFASDLGFPHSWPDQDDDIDPLYDRKKFLNTETGRPDPEQEVMNLAQDVIDKLKTF